VDELIEPVNSSTRPLDRAVERPSEPLRDLPIPFACEPATDTAPARFLAKLLLSDPARENETVSVLNRAACSTALEDMVSDPVSAL
jgi:hypothetical protein